MEELIRMKRQLDKVKEEIARNEGRQESLMQKLKELSLKNVEEAEKKLDDLEEKITKLEDQFESELEKLKADADGKL